MWFAGPGAAPSPSGSILALLESLQNAPHLEIHKDMITWILKVIDVAVKYEESVLIRISV